MKFSFKIQQYQTDAVDAVARVFQGQPYNAGVSYCVILVICPEHRSRSV